MPRPTTKVDLVKAANKQFEKMWKLIDSMTEAEMNSNFKFDASDKKEAHWSRDINLRDVLVHLYEWHRLLLKWVRANQSGENEPFLPAPYNWKTYGEMNVEFWKNHQSTHYEESREMVKKSHADVMALIDTFSEDELFTKGAYAWTGGAALGGYCVSTTSSHYDWAMKKIKLHMKAVRG